MLQPIKQKTKCDVRDCKNDAAFQFEVKGRGRCFLCADCLHALCEQARRLSVPKSPLNTIRKKMERRAEEMSYGRK